MARTIFVGDVHLRPRSPASNRPFLQFLREECDALYLVGDVFDYWIGAGHLRDADYRRELDALREKAKRCRVVFVHGNRDYLVDDAFARATGVAVAGPRARLRLAGSTVLAFHGDSIFNMNPGYAAYRTMMRSRPVSDLWGAVPAAAGKALARGLKGVSRKTTPSVAWSREAVAARVKPLFRGGVDVLVCGHIHMAQHQSIRVGGRDRDLFVLGDWMDGAGGIVVHDGRGFRLESWRG